MNTTYEIKDWLAALKISRSTLWRRIKSGEIPKPDKNLGSEKRPLWRWFQSTVDNYLSNPPTNPSV